MCESERWIKRNKWRSKRGFVRKSVCFFDIVRVFVCLFVRVCHKDGSPEERKVKKEKRGKKREESEERKEKRGK